MVSLRFNVPRDSAELILAGAREFAKNNDEKSILLWELENIELEPQDDYFNMNLPHGGWIYFNADEFKSEHLVMIIEQHPTIVDKDLLIAVLEALVKEK